MSSAMDSCGEGSSPRHSSNLTILQPPCVSSDNNIKKRSFSFDEPHIPGSLLQQCRSTGDVRSGDAYSLLSVKTSSLSTRSESSLSEYYSLETLVNESAHTSDLEDIGSEHRSLSPNDTEDAVSVYEDLPNSFCEMSGAASKSDVSSMSSVSSPEKKKGIKLSFRRKKTPKPPVLESQPPIENLKASPKAPTDEIKTPANSPDVQAEDLSIKPVTPNADSVTSVLQTDEKNEKSYKHPLKTSGIQMQSFDVDGDPDEVSENKDDAINEESQNDPIKDTEKNLKSFPDSRKSGSIPKFISMDHAITTKPPETLSIADEIEATEKAERKSHNPRTSSPSIQAGSQNVKKEHLYKILVIGELGAGKTSIIKRYVHQFFSQHYRATIGVDFALKVLNWDDDTVVRLQLWDIAGQERFGNMTRVYYKEAVGAFIVFDVTRSHTFDAILKWKTDLDSKVTLPNGGPIPVVLLANKCDQTKEGLVTKPSDMDQFCKENEITGWFETSAKDNINIEEASKFLVTKILRFEREGLMVNDSLDTSKFSVQNEQETSTKKPKCLC